MTLQSFHYLLFLAVVVGLGWALRGRPAARKNLLLLASYYFYACWDWRFLSLLLLITLLSHGVALRMAAAPRPGVRRAWLAAALVVLLAVLAAFKWAGFFEAGAAALLHALGLQAHLPVLRLLLPLGLSFFTFQAMSYLIDVYRGQQPACASLRDVALFVAFFATVQAGPVTRGRDLLPQLAALPPFEPACLQHGLALIVRGFVKKIVFADTLALHWVDPAFAHPAQFSGLFLLLALYAYSFQLYMDVSAYTDLARGSAFMCGLRLPKNFNRPYIASSVSNFWQRWHQSVSSFFRDYVFVSLGGSRRGAVYLNLMVTFVLIGVWHGAGWHFLLYGALHGAVICLERWHRARRTALGLPPLPQAGLGWLARVAITFNFVAFSRLLFRSADLDAAAAYLAALGTGLHGALPLSPQGLLALCGAAALHWLAPQAGARALALFKQASATLQGLALALLGYGMLALSVGGMPFLYFRF